jgi:hypothetical protein
MYLLTCRHGCPEKIEFRKENMRPYRVSDEVFQTGYVEEGKYELVVAGLKEKDEPPQGR